MQTTYKWQEIYHSALLETDWSKIATRIEAAELALYERKREFSLDHGGTPEENHAIEDALHGLETLRKDVEVWRSEKLA
jgi:hypothetical protein